MSNRTGQAKTKYLVQEQPLSRKLMKDAIKSAETLLELFYQTTSLLAFACLKELLNRTLDFF